MKNFGRALKMASSHWFSVFLATACSFAVAALWGANIGAFYPILEVTIKGNSAQEWVQLEIDKLEASKTEAQTSLVGVEETLADPQLDEFSLKTARDEKVALQQQIAIATAQAESYGRMQPWIERFVPGDPFSTIALIVVALVGSTLVRHVFLISNEMLVGRVAFNISRGLRNQIFERALHMDRASFGRHGNAGFVTLIIHTTDMLSQGLMNTLGAALREPLKLIACLAGAAMICWKLLLMSIVVAPVVGFLLYVVTQRIKGVSSRVLEKATGFHEVLLESLDNINTVQAFQREGWEQSRFEDATLLMKKIGLKFLFLTSLSKPIIEFLGIGMLGTTIIGGSYLVLNNKTAIMGIEICPQPLSVSALLVFFGMLVGVSDPLRKLSAVYGSIYAGTVAANAIFPLLDAASEIKDPESPKSASFPHTNLHVDSVTFGYEPASPVIQNIDLNIPFGSTIAIVGSNGSGKSTLINLLCRFYDPNEGALRIDGIDIRDMRIDDVRKRIALVNQQTELFDESVAYNIRYGNAEATDAEVEEAARMAHAHEFIVEVLSDGYDTVVGRNGNRLSGGQRQRIALARALLCNPEILILDEATSQIDMKSEQLIRESLQDIRGKQTMIIITHREKLLELADEAFEVVNGVLVEQPSLLGRAA
ncbi:MAG: ABC transporter ATP-binding protein [Pirellulaceae bacterium]